MDRGLVVPATVAAVAAAAGKGDGCLKVIKRDRLYCTTFREHCTLEIITDSLQEAGHTSGTVRITRRCLNARSCPECEACKIIDA